MVQVTITCDRAGFAQETTAKAAASHIDVAVSFIADSIKDNRPRGSRKWARGELSGLSLSNPGARWHLATTRGVVTAAQRRIGAVRPIQLARFETARALGAGEQAWMRRGGAAASRRVRASAKAMACCE